MSASSLSPITMNQLQSMNITPITRDELQTMKSVVDEEKRRQQVQRVVVSIYRQVQSIASTTTRNKYAASITQDMPFILKNMDEIISELQRLFPDSRVCFSKVNRTMDGYVELSEAEAKILELVNKRNIEPSILIDWS